MTLQTDKKVRSSTHLWQPDKVLLEMLWERLGLTGSQQDRMHQFLTWAESQIDQVEKKADSSPEAQTPEPVAFPSGLEIQIASLVNAMNRLMEMQMNQSATAPVPELASSSSVDSKDSPQKSRRISRTEVDETITNAINAIMTYNDSPDRHHNDKWAITINALKNFTPSQRKITQALQDRADEIAAHYQKHQIDPIKHNLRHRRKRKISEVVQIQPDENVVD